MSLPPGYLVYGVNPDTNAVEPLPTVQQSALPAGAATEAEQVIGNAFLQSIDNAVSGTLIVDVTNTVNVAVTSTVGLTDAQLRANAVAVSTSQLPAALGSQINTASLGVTASTQDIARTGETNETAPGTDTATSGLNGRLQRIAQNITTLISKLPAALGFTTASNSLPVVINSETGSGNITTQNLVPAGVATAGSAVEISLSGNSALIVQVTGTYTGALSLQITVDNTTWVTLSALPFRNVNTGAYSATIASAATGIFQSEVSGALKARITALAAVTGTAVVTLRSVTNTTMVDIGNPLPTGTNSIGNIATLTTVTTLTQLGGASVAAADGKANPTTAMVVNGDMQFNGTTWDRQRNNTDVTLLTSAARTTTQTSADITTYNAQALVVVLDMTNVGTGSVTVTIDGKDAVSGKYYNILTGAAITTNSTNRYRVGRDLAAVANSVAQDYLPRTIRIVVTANNANSATYSVGYNLLV